MTETFPRGTVCTHQTCRLLYRHGIPRFSLTHGFQRKHGLFLFKVCRDLKTPTIHQVYHWKLCLPISKFCTCNVSLHAHFPSLLSQIPIPRTFPRLHKTLQVDAYLPGTPARRFCPPRLKSTFLIGAPENFSLGVAFSSLRFSLGTRGSV